MQFLLAPDATARVARRHRRVAGDFPRRPPYGARLWLALSVAYMLLVTLLALLAQRDLRARPYLALLFAGEASSSLVALLAYRTVSPPSYLANFVVDGAIALTDPQRSRRRRRARRVRAGGARARRLHALACRCAHPARRARRSRRRAPR
jgi:hypothetical protein